MGIRSRNVTGNKGGTGLPPHPKELLEYKHLHRAYFPQISQGHWPLSHLASSLRGHVWLRLRCPVQTGTGHSYIVPEESLGPLVLTRAVGSAARASPYMAVCVTGGHEIRVLAYAQVGLAVVYVL